MGVADRKRPSIGEWMVLFAAGGIAAAASEFLGISLKWENAITFTVLLFAAVLIGTRSIWGRGAFWQDFIAIALLHCIVLAGIEQSLPATSSGPRGLPMVGVTMAEGVLIGVVLWTRSTHTSSDSS